MTAIAQNKLDSMHANPPAIGDYAVIGDGRTAALISRKGSLDWLCWPRFDSPAIFCRLLDPNGGGHFSIRPRDILNTIRRYIGQTNVLETRFQTSRGVLKLTEFMPVADMAFARAHLVPDHEIVRIVECESGEVELDISFAPRPNFARQRVRVMDRGMLGLRVETGSGLLTLHGELRFDIDRDTATAAVTMTAGERHAMILTFSREAPCVIPRVEDAARALERTVAWWEGWAKQFSYDGPYAEAVLRSVLTLKLLEFPTSGAFVAAVTTSLPERPGGELNWDYRYCWLRDSSVIMDALCGTGFDPEAEAFAEWLLHATRLSQPKLKVMYDVYGNRAPDESELPRLAGYADSKPVNIGNAARSQTQLDTYGEVVSAAAKLILRQKRSDRETSKVLCSFGKYVCEHWREPDAGIWESREKPVVHTHSRLLCWVALDALVRLDDSGLLHNFGRSDFRSTRDVIRKSIETECWNDDKKTYVSEPGGQMLDATLLHLTLYGFERGDSVRMQNTYARVREKLGAGGPLLYRNLDNGAPTEGAFGICGFWAVEFLAMGGGTLSEARETFEQLLTYANDVGLHAEEVDPQTGAALGNFPQAFTHVGLINAALAIEKRAKEELDRPENGSGPQS